MRRPSTRRRTSKGGDRANGPARSAGSCSSRSRIPSNPFEEPGPYTGFSRLVTTATTRVPRLSSLLPMASPEPEPAAPRASDPAGTELEGLKLGELKKRARQLGIDGAKIDDVDDADDPKAAMIELIRQSSGARAELETWKLKALKVRIRELGVSADKLESVDDSDDPKATAIDMILRAEAAAAAENLRKELQGLKLKALKLRAKETGIGPDDIDTIDDADDPKEAAIKMILARAAIPEAVVPLQTKPEKAGEGTLGRTVSVHPEPEQEVDDSHPFCSCLDREFVQKEIRWARKYNKKIIVLFEKDQRR
eukprot:COSAG01_NODE_2441_length_7690_cov_241.628903_1_plen_308_part_10